MVQISTKNLVEPKSSDKVLYYYKLIQHEPLANKCHPLGTQGATSGTNTATLGTTQTKQFNIKDTGSINQQRVVNIILTNGDGSKTDVARDLYYAWEHHENIGLWRVDWNTVHMSGSKQVVNAEYSECKISALPETEALNTAISQNITFEVTGIARRYDEDGNPFVMSEDDFDDGMFSTVAKFYNFTLPSQIGTDASGNIADNSSDDSHGGDSSATAKLGAATNDTGAGSQAASAGTQATGTPSHN